MGAWGLACEVGRGLLDLLFAPVCLACGAPIPTTASDRLVCRVCWTRARPLPLPRCERCWNPLPPGVAALTRSACPVCATLPPALRALRSAFVHDGPAKELVHALKFREWPAVAAPMGERMARLQLPLETLEEVRCVVPVPLSTVRRRERGYNQAALLAQAVAAHHGWAVVHDALSRTRATERQTTLHPSERRANVAGAFRVPAERAGALAGEHLLLVDDVWTTGATAIACGAALCEAGARCFSVLTFARALPELNRGAAASTGEPPARNP